MPRTPIHSRFIHLNVVLNATFVFILFVPALVSGQGSTPARGFQPGGSYALSDIESVNTDDGTLMLSLVLGKLAPGRGGLSGQVGLHYNSRLYDSRIQYYQDWEHPIGGQPQIVIRNMLVTSDQGGWNAGTGYELQLIDRMHQYPLEIAPQYPATETIRHYKVKVAFPDGSVREFLPHGFGSPMEEGYYDIRPDGWQTRFTGGMVQDVPYLTGTLTYYTFDGSYIRLEVEHDSDNQWGNNPWTLYFPDGTKVTNFGKRITDRNGNYVEWSNITYNGNPATQLMDQLGRKIIIENQASLNRAVIYVPGVGGVNLTYHVYWKAIQVYKTYSTEEPEKYDAQGYPDMLGNLFVVSRIDLPAEAGGLQYVFGYNAVDSGSVPCCTPSYGWGELSSITLPSGAQAQYQYGLDGLNGPGLNFMWDQVLKNAMGRKTLTYQQQYDGSSSPVSETWNYGSGMNTPEGGVIKQHGQPAYKTENADGSINEKLWQANTPQGFPVTSLYDPIRQINLYDPQRANQYVKTEFTSIRDANGTLSKTAIKDYNYDKNGNVTSVREYDWVDYGSVPRDSAGKPTGVPAGAVLKRVTTNTYVAATPDASDNSSNDVDSYWNSASRALKNVVASSEVSNGSTTLARAEFFYDNPATTGNLTQQKSWDSSKGAYSNPLTGSNSISTTAQYNQYGNTILTIDARGVQTRMVYGSVGAFSDLYPTLIQTAYQTAVQRTEAREYDFSTGLVIRVRDVDNDVATATSYDAFGRPTLVRVAETETEETRTLTEYSDINRRVIVRSDLTNLGDGKLVSIQHYDQLGRIRLTRQLEDASNPNSAYDETVGIKVQTRYQVTNPCQPANLPECLASNSSVLGSYQLVSNAYRASTSSAAGSETSMGWSRSRSDKGGRTIAVETFTGSSLPAPWGSNSASTGLVINASDANATTVTDQAGKMWRRLEDGLGRLSRVDEPDPNGALGSSSSPNQPTVYTYDALDNLTTVVQGVQQRTFVYDSLKRLTSATNPESGTISYQYDANSNLLVKTDARTDPSDSNKKVSTHFEYDLLNRLTRRWYNGSGSVSATTHNSPTLPAGVGATAEAKFYYDNQTLPAGAPSYTRGTALGHLVAQTYGSGSNGDYYAYDNLGRQTVKFQQTGTVNYRVSQQYNRAGSVSSIEYPSDSTTTNTFDLAGRLTAFGGNLGDGSLGTPRTYSTGIVYSSTGSMLKEQFGTNTPVYHKLHYNSRTQLCDVRVSNVNDEWGGELGALVNYYSTNWVHCGSGADNNGNVLMSQTIINSTYFEDRYSYDSLNRLTGVSEYPNGATLAGTQQYDYDRWGNRTINPASTLGINKQFTVNTANNRLGVPIGQPGVMNYDDAGNLITDTYTGAGNRTYDAENNMTSAMGNNSQMASYVYDVSGNRIKRTVDSVETWQVYGIDEQLLAEYPANGAATSPQKEYGYRAGKLLVTAEPPPAPTWTNVALASNGAIVSSSSTLSPNFASHVIDGSRRAINWTVWLDSTFNSFPDWLEVNFNGSKTISEIDVITQQDNPSNLVEPTLTTTFSLYGITTFDVQYWTGSAWTTVPGGGVTGNNKVWRQFTFSPITTTKIRVLVNGGADNAYSRVVEVEAWGQSFGATSSKVQWLVPDHLGTPRMVIDQTGTLANVKRHDYLPFGEELFVGRTAPLGYVGGDGGRQQFTQKERDVETGLDYFLARYYSPTQGRFTGADEPFAGQDEKDPQTWNLYSYTSNNPLNRVDEDGRRWFYKCEKKACDVLWVNPNDDGSYTSPGKGYVEFVPTTQYPHLIIYSEDGTQSYRFGEGRDGSPKILTLWTGGVENRPDHIIMAVGAGRGIAGLLSGAIRSFLTWRTAKAQEPAIQELFKNYRSGSELGKRVKDVLEHGGRERLTDIEREAAARWYEMMAKEKVKHQLKEAARELNLQRARYLREGGNLPGKIHQYKK